MKGFVHKLLTAVLLLFISALTSAAGENFLPSFPDVNQLQTDTHEKPAVYEKQSIEEVLNSGHDEELVKLSGELIKKLKCSTYLFRDKTGEIRVQIDNEDIPARGLLFSSPMIIKGEVNRDSERPAALQADQVIYRF